MPSYVWKGYYKRVSQSNTDGSGIIYNTEYVGQGFFGEPLIEDVRMPLFVLVVFYAGLFAILGDNKRKE